MKKTLKKIVKKATTRKPRASKPKVEKVELVTKEQTAVASRYVPTDENPTVFYNNMVMVVDKKGEPARLFTPGTDGVNYKQEAEVVANAIEGSVKNVAGEVEEE